MAYRRNKLKTARDIIRRIDNWPTAFGMRIWQNHQALRLLNFRDGLNLVCRQGNRDWDVVHELLFAGGYGRAMDFLKGLPGTPRVLDLGGNIGTFSLLAASSHKTAEIHSYEPGPPNYRLFEMNQLANPGLSKRMHLHKEAVAGRAGTAEWFFDDANPGASGLFASGSKFQVQMRSLPDVLDTIGSPIALAKIDIEGAEYDLIKGTPPEAWKQINAISLELHEDPAHEMKQAEFLKRMTEFGFKIQEETVCSFFMQR